MVHIQRQGEKESLTINASFLGFCNFYRLFIEGFSRIARALYARTKKECIGNWEWGDKGQNTSDELMTRVTRPPVLVYFDPLAQTKIET